MSSVGELILLANRVNGDETSKWGAPDVYYKLTKDINLGGMEWTPIGVSDSRLFNGMFYGGGYTVSGLKIANGGDYAGLFGYLGYRGEVYSLNVEGEEITLRSAVYSS